MLSCTSSSISTSSSSLAATATATTSTLSLLKSCKNIRSLEQVHAQIIRKGYEQDHFLITAFIAIINTILPSKHISYASSVFNRVHQPNMYLWNTLIKSHSTHSSLTSCFDIFRNMMIQNSYASADKYTFSSLLKSCTSVLALKEGKVVHGFVVKCGEENDLFVGSSLIDMYGKCGHIRDARKVFDGMSVRNEFTWTSMIVGYSSNGDCLEAKKLFNEMPVKNSASWNAMINGFVKSGDLVMAMGLFDQMPEKDIVTFTTLIDGFAKDGDMASAKALFDRLEEKDVVSWTAMICGYAQNGQAKEAVKMFVDMQDTNVKPDEYVMVCLMSACSRAGDWELAKWVDSYISERVIDMEHNHVIAALVDMHAKCGNLDRASFLFEKMHKRDLITYCSMIQGYSVHGHGVEAVALFHRMLKEGLRPDHVAFTVILSACSHADLFDEGIQIFDSIVNEHSLVPSSDHYACKVDLLGRAGRVREAYDFLKEMPIEPHAGAWGALLWACRIHGDMAIGKEVAARLFKIEPQNAGNYVLLSDMYADSNQWSDVNDVRNQMYENGIRKRPGCSWI